MIKIEFFIERIYECNLHKTRLLVALENLQNIIPLQIKHYENLSSEQSSFIDQIIFRFSKLQDTIGEKLFPFLLEYLGEEIKTKSFIDRLNRLEELGVVNKDVWLSLRKERNEITHEYSSNKIKVVENINAIFKAVYILLTIYDKYLSFCKTKLILNDNIIE